MPTIFGPPHNWRERYRERWAYRSAIIGQDSSEQREWLKVIPDRQDVFAVTAMDAREGGWLDALVLGGQTTQWAVPDWPRATTLLADAAAGSDVVLEVDTADRGFVVGGLAIAHIDDRTTELLTVTDVQADSLTVETLAGDWARHRTQLLPARLARWAQDVELGRAGHDTGELEVAFDYEPGANPAVAQALTPQIFRVVDPNSRTRPRDPRVRLVDRLSSPSYTFVDYAREAFPRPARAGLLLTLDGLEQVASLLTWFHGVRGACTAFWLPSFQEDLVVVDGLGTAEITIERIGYTDRLFPHEARRHLACIPAAGAITHRRVTAAVDNGDGTETLTLSGTAPADTLTLAFLLYVRLASDELDLAWASTMDAECVLEVVELPAEVPTST